MNRCVNAKLIFGQQTLQSSITLPHIRDPCLLTCILFLLPPWAFWVWVRVTAIHSFSCWLGKGTPLPFLHRGNEHFRMRKVFKGKWNVIILLNSVANFWCTVAEALKDYHPPNAIIQIEQLRNARTCWTNISYQVKHCATFIAGHKARINQPCTRSRYQELQPTPFVSRFGLRLKYWFHEY